MLHICHAKVPSQTENTMHISTGLINKLVTKMRALLASAWFINVSNLIFHSTSQPHLSKKERGKELQIINQTKTYQLKTNITHHLQLKEEKKTNKQKESPKSSLDVPGLMQNLTCHIDLRLREYLPLQRLDKGARQSGHQYFLYDNECMI